MKLIDRESGTIVAEILTNHSMSIDEALDLAGLTADEDGQILDGENGLNADYESLEMCWETIGHWNKESWGAEKPPENADALINKANDLIDVFHVQNGYDSELTLEYSNDLWEQYCRTGKVEPLQGTNREESKFAFTKLTKEDVSTMIAAHRKRVLPEKPLEETKPSVRDRLKEAGSAKTDAPKASAVKKKEDRSL